jgi:glycerate kinase
MTERGHAKRVVLAPDKFKGSPTAAEVAEALGAGLLGILPGLETIKLAEALYQGDDGAYVNFFGPADADRIQAAYPAKTLARLRRIKANYDPANLFASNDNITPVAGS